MVTTLEIKLTESLLQLSLLLKLPNIRVLFILTFIKTDIGNGLTTKCHFLHSDVGFVFYLKCIVKTYVCFSRVAIQYLKSFVLLKIITQRFMFSFLISVSLMPLYAIVKSVCYKIRYENGFDLDISLAC